MYSITRVSEDKISCDFLQVERGSTRSSRNSTGGLNKILPKKTVDIGLTEGADYHFKISEALKKYVKI